MDMKEQGILPGMESPSSGIETPRPTRPPVGSLRFRRPDRSQMRMVPVALDATIPPGHHVRVLWGVVERLDLSRFTTGLKVCEGEAGRPATDVRLLTALWLYAATQGVGSARELERLCKDHDAYRWLCGGVRVNYHTLSDFRVEHEEALDGLMTEVLAMLMEHKIVRVHRISQDGLRVREQVQERTGAEVKEHLGDGGFVKLEQIERAERAGVKMYAPPQQSRKDLDPYRVRETDSPELAAWRTRMATEEAKTIYKERAATSETVNADLRTYRGLGPFLVRGLRKVRCVVLWSALAYNLMHFGQVLLTE